jgi:hypothetical protein
MRASYYSYRAPFARGVDMTHQITDLLGIAMGGGEGNRQHDPTPMRTAADGPSRSAMPGYTSCVRGLW